MSIQSIPPAAAGPAFAAPSDRSAGVTAQQTGSTAPETPSVQPAASGSGITPEFEAALEQVRTAIAPVARNLQFSVDEDTGKTIVRIIDSATEEVIKQIPGDEILAIAKSIDKLQGLLLRQEA